MFFTEQKINKNEYDTLIKSLDNKPKRFMWLFNFLINPYEHFSTTICFIIGILILFTLAYIGYTTSLNFPGLFGAESTLGKSFPYSSILKSLFISWVCTSLMFYTMSKILGGLYLRIFDFFAFCALAKFPFFVAMLLDSISYHINPRLVNFNDKPETNVYINIYTGILDTVVVVMIFWHIILYFFAFKQASGLNHNRNWLGFVISMVTLHPLLTFWLNPLHG